MKQKTFRAVIVAIGLVHALGAAAAVPSSAAELIARAGNTEEEHEREIALRNLASSPVYERLRAEARQLADFVSNWNSREQSLTFYSRERTRRPDGLQDYDFKVRADSPLIPITELYRGRILAWELIESSTIRVVNTKLRALYHAEASRSFRAVAAAFPKNRIPGAYLGNAIPWPKNYASIDNAPEWAVLQREHIERYRDIIHWWIDQRQRADGAFGGGLLRRWRFSQ